jgi:hypothetical protein
VPPPTAAWPNPYAQAPGSPAGPPPAASPYGPPASMLPAQSGHAYSYAPGYIAPAQGLSVASLVCGLAALVLTLLWIGFLPGLAAIITGHLASKRQPNSRGFWLTGLITGYFSAAVGLLAALILVVYFASLGSFSPNDYGVGSN